MVLRNVCMAMLMKDCCLNHASKYLTCMKIQEQGMYLVNHLTKKISILTHHYIQLLIMSVC